ncbi:MAG: hypothetical protein ACI8Q1_003243 [Parvicella sp.]|jgi:hypothetical protein
MNHQRLPVSEVLWLRDTETALVVTKDLRITFCGTVIMGMAAWVVYLFEVNLTMPLFPIYKST